MEVVCSAHVWYGDERVHMELLYDPIELVKRHRPSYWSEEKATVEAWALVKDYARRYLPTYWAHIQELEGEYSLLFASNERHVLSFFFWFIS